MYDLLILFDIDPVWVYSFACHLPEIVDEADRHSWSERGAFSRPAEGQPRGHTAPHEGGPGYESKGHHHWKLWKPNVIGEVAS